MAANDALAIGIAAAEGEQRERFLALGGLALGAALYGAGRWCAATGNGTRQEAWLKQ